MNKSLMSYDPVTSRGRVPWPHFVRKLKVTVPQLSIMIIYNSTLSILIQWIRDLLSGDNLI